MRDRPWSAGGVIGFIIVVCLVAAVLVFVSTQQSLPFGAGESATNRERIATLSYWNSLIEIDARFQESAKPFLAKLEQGDTNSLPPLDVLAKFAEWSSSASNKYNSDVGNLAVSGVDQRLLDETNADLRREVALVQHLSGMAENAQLYSDWAMRRKSRPTQELLTDVLDSFFMGLQGRPFEGYNNMKKKLSALDAEGQRIAQGYVAHAEAFNLLVQQVASDKVREIELRAFLSKKYGVEFRPRPDPN